MQKWGGGGEPGGRRWASWRRSNFPKAGKFQKPSGSLGSALSPVVEQPYLIWGWSGSRNFEGRWAALGAEQMSRKAGNVKVGKLHELSTHQP
jgi:hypothetical protein